MRVHGEIVAPHADSLRAAFPDASERVVVFPHGLMGTKFYWQLDLVTPTVSLRGDRSATTKPGAFATRVR